MTFCPVCKNLTKKIQLFTGEIDHCVACETLALPKAGTAEVTATETRNAVTKDGYWYTCLVPKCTNARSTNKSYCDTCEASAADTGSWTRPTLGLAKC